MKHHLLDNGMDMANTQWVFHGEDYEVMSEDDDDEDNDNSGELSSSGYDEPRMMDCGKCY